MASETSPNDNGHLDILNDDAFWIMLKNLTGHEVIDEPVAAAFKKRAQLAPFSASQAIARGAEGSNNISEERSTDGADR